MHEQGFDLVRVIGKHADPDADPDVQRRALRRHRALERGALTMRGYDRVLKVAWTLADLDGADRPGADHVGRALYLRKAMAA